MHKLTKIGVVSFAKVMGMSGALMGLVFGLFYGVFMILAAIIGFSAAAGGEQEGFGLAAGGLMGAVCVIVLFPLMYGALSFLFGLIYALIINLVLNLAGGLEFEMEALYDKPL